MGAAGRLDARGDPAAPPFFRLIPWLAVELERLYGYEPHMMTSSHHFDSTPAGGFTLVEALVAISMTALAGSVLLLGVTSSLQNADEAYRQTVALGLAQQLMDEVVGSSSIAEIDAYNGSGSTPPVDRWGVPLGTEDGGGGQRHANFRVPAGLLDVFGRNVRVSRVAPPDLTVPLSAGQASDYRLAVVRVTYTAPNTPARELVRLQRVVAKVPPYEPLP